jgi:hypothetical protein
MANVQADFAALGFLSLLINHRIAPTSGMQKDTIFSIRLRSSELDSVGAGGGVVGSILFPPSEVWF